MPQTSNVVTMCNEELEFAISQYVDGTLSAAERSALELRLADDAEARALLTEYRQLNQMLKASPLPDVKWDALAQAISGAVDQAELAQASRMRMPAWVRAVALPLAMAASVLIVAGVAIHALIPNHHNQGVSPESPLAKITPTPTPAPVVEMAIVIGPHVDKIEGPAEISVAVGPGDAVKDEPSLAQYSDDVTLRPSHVTIAAGVIPTHNVTRNAFE